MEQEQLCKSYDLTGIILLCGSMYAETIQASC
jgi:hypothetical protein